MGIQPPFLYKNDTVGIISTARQVSEEAMEKAIQVFQSWGLKVRLGRHLYAKDHQFAGKDQQRIEDFQRMIDDPEIKAIICAKGGYGTTRIIDSINFEKLVKGPKWIGGFSDVTAILCQLHNLNVESIHCIMPGLFNKKGIEDSVESLRKVLFGEKNNISCAYHEFNRHGKVKGQVIGGNLSILNNIIGTPSDIDTSGKILFLEDLDEYIYHIDRMMVHLKRAGKLTNLAALMVGYMSDMNDNETPYGKTAYEIIREHVEGFKYPVCFGFPVGHEAVNLAIPCSRIGRLKIVGEGTILEF